MTHNANPIARDRAWGCGLGNLLILFVGAALVMVSCERQDGSAASVGVVPAQTRPAAAQLQRFECNAPCMGMPARIVMFARDSAHAKAAGDAAIAGMNRLDQLLSDYRDDSETAAVNRAAGGEAVNVSPDFLAVLTASLANSHRSEGAFDVTIGPVTQLWRAAAREQRSPSQAEIDAAHALVNWRDVEVDVARSQVRLMKPGMQLDFGGIGKGFAADRAMNVLREHGVSIALVALAGDIRLGDPPPGKLGWSIALADGLHDELADDAPILQLANCGVSTSGDAEQFIVLDGERRSHIIDPREGLGMRDRNAVSIIAPDATTADALATAASVMPRDRAIALIEATEGVAARFVWLDGDSIYVSTTGHFPGIRN